MSTLMTIAERETFLAGTHIAILSVPDGHASLLIPIWYAYTSGGEIRISTPSGSRKLGLIQESGYGDPISGTPERRAVLRIDQGRVVIVDHHPHPAATVAHVRLRQGVRLTPAKPTACPSCRNGRPAASTYTQPP
jgi:hypothetical protein